MNLEAHIAWNKLENDGRMRWKLDLARGETNEEKHSDFFNRYDRCGLLEISEPKVKLTGAYKDGVELKVEGDGWEIVDVMENNCFDCDLYANNCRPKVDGNSLTVADWATESAKVLFD